MTDMHWSTTRRAMLLAASAAALGVRGLAPNAVTGSSHATQLRQALGLQEAADVLGLTLQSARNWPETAQPLITAGAHRLRNVIGQEWHTAAHTIPGLVEEDWRLGRLFEAGDLCFSATELGLLFG